MGEPGAEPDGAPARWSAAGCRGVAAVDLGDQSPPGVILGVREEQPGGWRSAAPSARALIPEAARRGGVVVEAGATRGEPRPRWTTVAPMVATTRPARAPLGVVTARIVADTEPSATAHAPRRRALRLRWGAATSTTARAGSRRRKGKQAGGRRLAASPAPPAGPGDDAPTTTAIASTTAAVSTTSAAGPGDVGPRLRRAAPRRTAPGGGTAAATARQRRRGCWPARRSGPARSRWQQRHEAQGQDPQEGDSQLIT